MSGGGGGGGGVIIIKKKAKGHGHHGGAWKVAYADFVTAMMALFMVMWLLSQTDKDTQHKLSEYFRTGVFEGAPSVLAGGMGVQDNAYVDGEMTFATESALLKREARNLRAQIDAEASKDDSALAGLSDHVKVSVTDDGLLIEITDAKDDVLFDRASSQLKPRLIALLDKLGPLLADLHNDLQLHGHSDAKAFPAGSSQTNWGLSFERADRARAELERFLRAGQIKGVFAHGASKPLNAKDPMAAENRRISILALRRVPVETAPAARPASSRNPP